MADTEQQFCAEIRRLLQLAEEYESYNQSTDPDFIIRRSVMPEIKSQIRTVASLYRDMAHNLKHQIVASHPPEVERDYIMQPGFQVVRDRASWKTRLWQYIRKRF